MNLDEARRKTTIATALAAGLLTAGCAGHPHGVMEPVATIVPGTGAVAMIVATNRAADPSPSIAYGGRRGEGLRYASVVVSLPPDARRTAGEIQWPAQLPPDPATDFVVRANAPLTKTQAFDAVSRAAGAAAKHRVLVFVHGFNNRYEDAVFRFAQIAHDSGSRDVPVLFTWPSKGTTLAYGADRENATWSRDALEATLTDLAADPKVDGVAILAHSMGNWVTLEALRQMGIRHGGIPAKIDDVILAAPDVDVDIAGQEIASMGARRPHFTLFTSKDDAALALSGDLWGGSRLGAIDPRRDPMRKRLADQGITVYDLAGMADGTGLNHDTFATSPEVVRLIGTRIADGQAIGDAPRHDIGDRIAGGTADVTGFLINAPRAIYDEDARSALTGGLGRTTGALLGRREDRDDAEATGSPGG